MALGFRVTVTRVNFQRVFENRGLNGYIAYKYNRGFWEHY